MTRDDIYEHLAQVYLGKKNKSQQEKKYQFNAWLVINIVITLVIFASAFYGLTAFLARRPDAFQNKIIYSLTNGPIRIKYNLGYPYPSVKTFSLSVPQINVAKYKALQFSARGTEDGYPGIIRVELKNRRNETASVFVDNIQLEWRSVHIPFDRFQKIVDWSDIEEVSFVLESWNAVKGKGVVLLEDVCFSN